MPQHKYQLQSGTKWIAKFRYFDPKTGQNKVEYKRGFDTKREAKKYEEDFLEALARKEMPVPEEEIERTYGDVFHEYMASHRRDDMKESTLGTKLEIFEHHIFPVFEDMLIEQITPDDIAEWQMTIKNKTYGNGKHYSAAFQRTIQSQFNTIINYAVSKGYITCNPMADVKNMGIKDKRVEFWSPEEYERFAIEAMKYPRMYYAYEVLYWCGLREGEMLALTPADIDFNNKTLSVTKTYMRLNGKDYITPPKTNSSIRVVSMPTFLCDELKEYLAMLYSPSPDQRIFMMDKSKLLNTFHKISDDVGLKRITIHGLRHSHVSLLISKKYDIFEVSRRIGHKSIRTTQDIYGHLFTDVQKTIADDLDAFRRV